jgi:hypothetical protein
MRKSVENSRPHFVLHFVRQLFPFCYMIKNNNQIMLHSFDQFHMCVFFALVVKSIQTFNKVYFSAFCEYVLYLNRTNDFFL